MYIKNANSATDDKTFNLRIILRYNKTGKTTIL